jgi:hypothetical protein
MLRFVVACLLAAYALGPLPATTPENVYPVSAGPQCPGLSLETTFLCVFLAFRIDGVSLHEFVEIDWGDGTVEWADCPGGVVCWSMVSHTYAADGAYTITATAITGCPGNTNTVVAQVHASPEFPLYSESQGENWIQPATSDPLEIVKLRRSTIDWGDGNPIEEFEWISCKEGVLCVPRHDYASAGVYTIEARIEYLDAWEGTCYERVATLQATIGPQTPVQNTTWGAIKTLYR